MLNSCAPGVAVVNIDNGYGAAHLAAAINSRIPVAADAAPLPRTHDVPAGLPRAPCPGTEEG
jgi:hypothetical protein